MKSIIVAVAFLLTCATGCQTSIQTSLDPSVAQNLGQQKVEVDLIGVNAHDKASYEGMSVQAYWGETGSRPEFALQNNKFVKKVILSPRTPSATINDTDP